MARLGTDARPDPVTDDDREEVEARFPKLAQDGYRVTSRGIDTYNCVAWIARDIRRWWARGDGFHWPVPAADDSLQGHIVVFEHLGFCRCDDGDLEEGIEKIAVYGSDESFEHVAFQRPDGKWSSKLGELSDIRHDRLESIQGTGVFEYGRVVAYMRRSREPHELADSDTGLLTP
jgi:hypothetical protein